MMQGVGSRFDFHMHKTLCDLRYGRILIVLRGSSEVLASAPEKFLISLLIFQILWAPSKI